MHGTVVCRTYYVATSIFLVRTSQRLSQFRGACSHTPQILQVAGTVDGVKEPTATFSACFGAAFIMLHPTKYAAMLADKMQKHGATAWLVNTGWTGGRYGAT